MTTAAEIMSSYKFVQIFVVCAFVTALCFLTWYDYRELASEKYSPVRSCVPGQLSCYCTGDSSPGVVAGSCNPATWRQVLEDGLRRGLLVVTGSCWSGVRTKACINMGPPGEPGGARLTKEGRTGPGGKLSSQESPCESVVGPRQWVLSGHQPLQYSQTQNFLPSILFEMIQS